MPDQQQQATAPAPATGTEATTPPGANNTNSTSTPSSAPATAATASTNNNNAQQQNTSNNNTTNNNNNNNNRPRFVGAVTTLPVLLHRVETSKKDQFLHLQREIEPYILGIFDFPADIMPAILLLADPKVTFFLSRPTRDSIIRDHHLPVPLSADDKVYLDRVLKQQQEAFSDRLVELDQNITRLFGILWGQCSHALQEEVKLDALYRVKSLAQDGVWLIQTLQQICSGVDKRASPYLVTYHICRDFYNLKQYRGERADEYYRRFKHQKDTVELLNANVALHENLVALESNFFDIQPSKDKFYATAFIANCDQDRYAGLLANLSNEMLQGYDKYPTNLQSAFELLGRWENTPGSSTTPNNSNNTNRNNNNRRRNTRRGRGRGRGPDVQLAQVTPNPRAGYNNVTINTAFCNPDDGGCGHNGHSFNYCPDNPRNHNRVPESPGSDTSSSDSDNTHGPVPATFQGMNLVNETPTAHRTRIEDILPSLLKGDLLLDSGCNGSSVCDKDLIVDIHEIPASCSHTNNAATSFTLAGTLKRIPMPVKYDPNSFANILAMSYFWSHPDYTVFCNSDDSDCIYIRTPTEVLEFVFVADGLFILNNNLPNESVNPYSPKVTLLSTVEEMKRLFSPRQIALADRARTLRKRIGCPGKTTFTRILRSNQLINCPITADDFQRSITIFGEDPARLQGAATRPSATSNSPHDYVRVPDDILRLHPTDELEVDFCFVEGIPFLHSYSRKIQYTELDAISSRHARVFIPLVKLHKKRYTKRGFEITKIHADSEFEPLKNNILPTLFCPKARGEHAKAVERNTRTVKDKIRCIYHDNPYRRIPKVMIVSLVANAKFWCNAFTKIGNISRDLSPHTIMTGANKLDYNNITLSFGTYCMIYTETNSRTDNARAEHGIALEPYSEDHKTWWFMTLPHGNKVRGWGWTELPTTQAVINQVEELATNEGLHEFPEYPRFEIEPGIDWNNEQHESFSDSDDSDYRIMLPNDARNNDIELKGFDADVTEVHDDDASTIFVPQEENNNINENENTSENSENIDNTVDDAIDSDDDDKYYTEEQYVQDHNNRNSLISNLIQESNDDINNFEQQLQRDLDEAEAALQQLSHDQADDANDDASAPSNDNDNTTTTDSGDDINDTTNTTTESGDDNNNNATHGGLHSNRLSIGLSPSLILPEAVNRIPKPNSKFVQNLEVQLSQIFKDNYHNKLTQEEKERQVFNATVNICLAQFEQMSANKGIKIYGDKAVAALIKEYRQLIDMKVFSRFKTSQLTSEIRQKALRAINLIKEKRDFSVKGRCVGDGRTQRAYISKEEASSPTLSNEAFFMSLMVDIEEKRDIAIFDVPGAYLQANMPEERTTLLKFVNQYVDMVLDADPSFAPDVHYEGSTKVLYVKLDKALYGCMESGLMWYNMYTDVLKGMGFELNPYDPCVANKMINGKQCTVTFYVDDNKISHVDPEVVTSVIEALKEKFGNITVQRGNDLDFLGMIINKDGDKITIDMRSYIKQTLELFEEHEKLTTTTSSPARKTLFLTKDTDPLLPQDKSEIFHTLVAKLLWIAKRGRPDVELPVAFLCTRVHKPTDRDWRKLKRVLQFLKGTINDIRKLGVSDLSHMLAYIDASYAVHPDMRSHTGGLLSFGIGILLQSSRKQGLNSKSSTEAELIGLGDYVPFIVWARNFLDAQGYKPKHTTVFQDNQSTIRMAKNGRKSATGKSRHIHIRYFFVHDRVNKGEFKIEHCPTDEMISDFYTKPLQGKLFHNMRKVVLGHEPISFLRNLKKRVDNVDSSYVESKASVRGTIESK